MEVLTIDYRRGLKYQLDKTVLAQLQGEYGAMNADVHTRWLSVSADNILTIKQGYAWNGGNFPARDTPDAMPGFLVHDALYQLTRMGWFNRADADREMRYRHRADGVGRFRAWYIYQAVRRFGNKAADAGSMRPVLHAP